MIKKIHTLFTLIFFCFGVWSCINYTPSDNPAYKLTFSCDTVSFDTVFSTRPTTTARFMIYNNNNKPLNIESVYLGNGSQSCFRFNVDGETTSASKRLKNIYIDAHDSLYVFVELTTDETTDSIPVMVLDSLMFEYNSNISNVKLMAFNQNAIILKNYTLPSDCTFTSKKPYVVLGHLYIPATTTLTLDSGTHIYFHNDANFVVDGNLISNGTLHHPIILRGDRFDNMEDEDQTPYNFLASQWGGLYLQNPNGDYKLNYTDIRCGTYGVVLVGGSRIKPSLTIKNSKIDMIGTYGVYSQNGNVKIENSLISNCGNTCLLALGGSLLVQQSTLANYYPWSSHESAVWLANYYNNDAHDDYFPIESAVFENSIIYGSNLKELTIVKDSASDSEFNFFVHNCLVKYPQINDGNFSDNIWVSKDNVTTVSVFKNTSIENFNTNGYFNFELDKNSPAIGKANAAVAALFPYDLNGNSRLGDNAPDIGAYEY